VADAPASRVTVPRAARGERLDKFLSHALPGLSIERVQALIEQGHVLIAGKKSQITRKLWGGEEIEVSPPAPRPVQTSASGPPLPVLYEDAQIVIVNKPADLVVTPEGSRPSVVGLLAARMGGFDVDGSAQPGVVHRLDRETSGCLALTRTDAATAWLKSAFNAKQIDKRYWAFVLGQPPDELRLDTPYGRDPSDPRLFTSRVPSARRAVLTSRVRERFQDGAWLEIHLDTGRTHQIRVQLSDAGYPVLGDAVYGPRQTRLHPASAVIGRHALHAHRLSIQRESAEPIVVETPLPPELERGLVMLRGASEGRQG
jgi:23S rRNA pseudouridine1911/1915/1917 synthase